MYKCSYCGRMLKYPVAHICNGNFRKRKLSFVDTELIKVRDKVTEEYNDLLEKINKLKKFINSSACIEQVGKDHFILLCEQLSAMESYKMTLYNRLCLFSKKDYFG
jgi:hypothetical protein